MGEISYLATREHAIIMVQFNLKVQGDTYNIIFKKPQLCFKTHRPAWWQLLYQYCWFSEHIKNEHSVKIINSTTVLWICKMRAGKRWRLWSKLVMRARPSPHVLATTLSRGFEIQTRFQITNEAQLARKTNQRVCRLRREKPKEVVFLSSSAAVLLLLPREQVILWADGPQGTSLHDSFREWKSDFQDEA